MNEDILNLDFMLCDLGTVWHPCIKALCSAPFLCPTSSPTPQAPSLMYLLYVLNSVYIFIKYLVLLLCVCTFNSKIPHYITLR